jgi:hypothetical protein
MAPAACLRGLRFRVSGTGQALRLAGKLPAFSGQSVRHLDKGHGVL